MRHRWRRRRQAVECGDVFAFGGASVCSGVHALTIPHSIKKRPGELPGIPETPASVLGEVAHGFEVLGRNHRNVGDQEVYSGGGQAIPDAELLDASPSAVDLNPSRDLAGRVSARKRAHWRHVAWGPSSHLLSGNCTRDTSWPALK